VYGILVGELKGGDHWEDLGIDEGGSIVKIDLRVRELEIVDWIHLVWCWDSWQAIVSMVFNL
jgi:hypothetical protein